MRSTTQVFCRMFLTWDLSHVFLMIRLGLWVSGSQTSKRSDLSYRIPGICCQHGITVDFDLGPLAEVVVVRLLHCKVALLPTPPPHPLPDCPLRKEGTTCSQHLRGEGSASLRMEHLHTIFGILCEGFVYSPPLIYFFISLYQYELMNIYY